MENNFKSISLKVWIVLVSGLFLRFFLALSTFHPDIRALNLGGQLVASGNILNLYDYLSSCAAGNPLVKTFGTDLFIYPPAIYLYHGIFNFLFTAIFGNYIMNSNIIENAATFGNIYFNIHLLLLKLPYLLFDILSAVYIAKLFDSKREQFLAFCFWVFNPVNLYATYMMGQFDVIPAFFTILCLYFIKKEKLGFAALSLGLGAAFKIYPFFLLVPLLLVEKRWIKRIELVFLGFLPYLITVIPYLASHGFRSSALLAGLTNKSLYASIPISAGENLILFPLTLVIFYLSFYFYNFRDFLWQKFFVVLLLFFIFTHYHPQWFLWITPFLIIDLIRSNFRNAILIVLSSISYFALLFFFDSSLTVGIFAPIFPFLYSLPSIWVMLGINIDYNFSRSVFQTLFAGVGFYYIYQFFTKLFARVHGSERV